MQDDAEQSGPVGLKLTIKVVPKSQLEIFDETRYNDAVAAAILHCNGTGGCLSVGDLGTK